MRRLVLLLSLLSAVGGCGGQYTLTVGDHVGPLGQDAAVVVRLQRNDFFVLSLPVKEAAIRFVSPDGRERAAYTDQPTRHSINL